MRFSRPEIRVITHGYHMIPRSIHVVITYRIQYKLYNSQNLGTLKPPNARGLTTFFLIDTFKAKVTIPIVTPWEQINFLETWCLRLSGLTHQIQKSLGLSNMLQDK